MVVIQADHTNIRSGPGTAYDVVDVMQAGETCAASARSEDGQWVRLAGDTERWVSLLVVEVSGAGDLPVVTMPTAPVAAAAAAPFVIVRGERVNIRSGPGLAYHIVGVTTRDTTHAVIGRSQDGEWYRLATQEERWISAALLEFPGNSPLEVILPTTQVPMSAASPTPGGLKAPRLIEPIDGLTLWPSNEITFRWQWTGGPLEPNQGFEVRLWVEDSADHLGVAPPVPYVPDPNYVYGLHVGSVRSAPGVTGVSTSGWANLWWTVAVVQVDPYQTLGSEAQPFCLRTQLR